MDYFHATVLSAGIVICVAKTYFPQNSQTRLGMGKRIWYNSVTYVYNAYASLLILLTSNNIFKLCDYVSLYFKFFK